ncbi:MAG: flagellin [Chlamydiia bacterium]|nr:flagellin [Chlamydiia bacterium]
MKISPSRNAVQAYLGVQNAADGLYASMRRLSSGHRITGPGDAPADYGIAENLQYQIRNSQTAQRNLEDARNYLHTADAWLQSSHDILHRMAELATSAGDGSKGQDDLHALETEFEQLKEELRRIASQASFNGVNVAGRDQMLAYDQDRETFFFSQLDGGEAYYLEHKVASGIQGNNAADFLYDPAKAFTKSADGRYVFYVDSNDNLVKFDIEAGNLTRDTVDSEDKGVEVDNQGRLWYASETAAGSGVYALAQMNVDTWTQDTTLISSSDITDMGSKEFKIYENRIYYLDSSDNVVSRSLTEPGEVKIEMASTEHSFTTTLGQFAISADGLYVADVSAAGIVRVTNLETQVGNTINVGAAVTIADLTFSSDGGEILFTDSATGNIHRLELRLGDTPTFGSSLRLHLATGASGFSGLSLDGGSHRARIRLQQGPDGGQVSFLSAGDVRLQALGLSRIKMGDPDSAKAALKAVQQATHRVGLQRSTIGGQLSRLEKAHTAMGAYIDNVSMAESSLRDADMARDSSEMAAWQVQQQASLAIMAQANVQSQNVLRLLTS